MYQYFHGLQPSLFTYLYETIVLEKFKTKEVPVLLTMTVRLYFTVSVYTFTWIIAFHVQRLTGWYYSVGSGK